MKTITIVSFLALATGTFAIAVPNAIPNFSNDKLSEAVRKQRDLGTTPAKIPISNLFGRGECVAAYCGSHNDCKIHAFCDVCERSLCKKAGGEKRPPSPSPPPSPGPDDHKKQKVSKHH